MPSSDTPPDPSVGKADIVRGIVRTEVENMLREPQANLPPEYLAWLPQFIDLNMLQHGPRHRNTGPDPIPIESVTSASSTTSQAGAPFQIDTFATAGSATYTTPTTATGDLPLAIVMEVIGGGGGGAGVIGTSAASAASGAQRGGGGGGGAGYARVVVTSALDGIEASYTVVVGAGGAFGTSASVAGAAGGDSYVSGITGDYVVAHGGGGGLGINAATSQPSGGSGGSGSVGDVLAAGNDGVSGAFQAGGTGGSTVYGGGGRGATWPDTTPAGNSSNGLKGGGGGGSVQLGTSSGNSGSSGGDGYVVITAYG